MKRSSFTMTNTETARASNPEPINYLFNKTADQMHAVGARGGRARGRNLRARLSEFRQAPVAPVVVPDAETAAEAVSTLDAQFPWLVGAERKRTRNRVY